MRTPVRLAATALLLTPLTACFAGGQSGSEGAGDDRIRLAMLQPPRSGLSPLSDDAFKLSRWSTAETLVELDDLGDPVPGLATSWERLDDRTWRLELRDDVLFHDGTPLDADAVVTALTAASEASPVPRILDGFRLDVEADPDDPDGAVVLTTGEVDPLLPARLSSPQLSVLAPSAYAGDGPVDPVGTGTGPFELVSSEGTAGATLDRFDDYWGTPAAASGIDVSYVPDGTARAAALRTGEADVVEAVPVAQLPGIEPSLLHEVSMPRTNTLYLNTDTGPFADPAVRAAARTALDRARLVADVYEGRADEAEGLLGPALPWAAPLREDPAYAAELDRRVEPATPAEVDGAEVLLGTFTDRAELPEVAVLLEQQLEAAGFEVTQEVREYQFIEADALDGAFDAFLLSRATILDSGDPVAYLASDFSCDGTFNLSQFCDPAVDRAIDRAAATPAGDERRAAIVAAEAAVLSRDAALPLLHERVVQGEAAGVEGALRDPRERELVDETTRVG
ncbi:ABC transporter substrate-binding protein [Nocardioides sp. CFH 31398]|uniref:ABC transporter substrate-binding protein n=1 Tax=Nocardioides sp. CFH 31398 TaxID=2919579 RepID=UPI001F051C0E|nr:ABC transporter substrate-binding protein [Nocardioides sp. CFH 31398]MCH1866248.1 ABC transporter substrate-binding protein [Nocardioides sp. CFH 31398]